MQVKGVNWRAKLVLAEFKHWMEADLDRSKDDVIISFREMLERLKNRRKVKEQVET